MRPPGEIRQALRDCLTPGGPALTWRDAAGCLAAAGLINLAAPAELRLVQTTVENMRRAGELEPRATVRVAGARRPMVAYARASWATEWGGQPHQALAGVLQAWSR